MTGQKVSAHLQTATTPENKEVIEEIICSQEDHPGTHAPLKDIPEGLKISQSSVQRMSKRKVIKQFKLFKTPYRNDVTQKRRVEHPGCLLEKFETNHK